MAAIRAAMDGVAILDAAQLYTFLNDAHARIYGYEDPGDLIGRSWRELYDEDEVRRFEDDVMPAFRQAGRWRGEAVGRRRDGSRFPQEVSLTALGGGGLVCVVRDITDRKETEERITALAYRDTLTGLPNRRLFEDRLQVALAQAHRYRHRLGVFFLDLDRFKDVNDKLGHAAGDNLLQAVSERLSSCVREGDTVARLAGDEFTLLLPGVHYAEDVVKVADKVFEAMRRPFDVQGREIRITASSGVCLYPEDGNDPETLLKRADIAMYRAKERGRDNYQLYSPAMTAPSQEKLSLETNLRSALARNELALYYQPCLELASGRIVAVEALLRWKHPSLGLVFPKDFLSLADFTGLILPMGEWVLATACEQVRAWQVEGAISLKVAVNLAAHELREPGVVTQVERTLQKSGLPPGCLRLEVPEGYAMQNAEQVLETLRALKALGVQLTIDGFGAGFSSLAHLRRLPVDALKLDLSFVRDTTSDPDDASLVTAVIAVAHSLRLKVVAQGVETEDQLALLRSLHCDEVQGYLWSPPVPPAACARLLRGTILGVPENPSAPGEGKAERPEEGN
jgi:diguanylate cyclase (GGDEF)-like protein/PAS domain S-box-containing protein